MRVLIWLILVIMFAGVMLADELTRAVQEQLQTQGAYSGPLDGQRSAEFVNALKAYQLRHNLPASGVVDRPTAKALDDENGLGLPQDSATAAKRNVSTPAASSPPASRPPNTPAPVSTAAVAVATPSPSIAGTSAPVPPAPSPVSPTPRQTPTDSPIHTATLSPSPIQSPTLSPSPIHSPTPAPSPIQSVTPAPSPLYSPGTSPSPSQSPTPLPLASASRPEESSGLITTERVTSFLRAFLRAGEGKYVTPQLRFYSFPVDYFGHGQVNQQFVRSDSLRYMRRWSRRRYMLTDPVKIMPVDSETVTADFTIAYTVQRGKRRTSGRTSNRVTLREINGELKIVAIKEQRVADQPSPAPR